MTATPATLYGAQMTLLTGNTGGALQQLIASYLNGKENAFIENIVLASQASGAVIGVARIPVPFTPVGFTMITDTSLGSATVSLGNAGSGNAAIYKAAATFTSTDTPTSYGKTASYGVPVLTGIDSQGTSTSTGGLNGGGGYEDICLTVGTAALPSSGNLTVITRFLLP